MGQKQNDMAYGQLNQLDYDWIPSAARNLLAEKRLNNHPIRKPGGRLSPSPLRVFLRVRFTPRGTRAGSI